LSLQFVLAWGLHHLSFSFLLAGSKELWFDFPEVYAVRKKIWKDYFLFFLDEKQETNNNKFYPFEGLKPIVCFECIVGSSKSDFRYFTQQLKHEMSCSSILHVIWEFYFFLNNSFIDFIWILCFFSEWHVSAHKLIQANA